MDKALKFLNGDEKEIINSLEEKMKKAAAELEFEQAAEYRDLIENVKRIGEKQKINDTGGDDRDIIAMQRPAMRQLWLFSLSEAASFSAEIIFI